MSKYIDGYVLPIPSDKIEAYRAIAEQAGAIWRKHGALEYRECIGEDLEPKGDFVPFAKLANAQPGETVVFAYVVFESRAHRDEVNAKVMADPYFATLDPTDMPFDCSRMSWGGFQTIVEA